MENHKRADVMVVLGSDSDFPAMEPCFRTLKKFGVPFTATVCSAHRSPDRAARLAATARDEGYSVIIGAAGLAAHLPGVMAAYTTLPVIAVPLAAGALAGVDALLSEVQMPPGIPVATVAINGGLNAAILSCQILALRDERLALSLAEYKEELAAAVDERAAKLQMKLREQAYIGDTVES